MKSGGWFFLAVILAVAMGCGSAGDVSVATVDTAGPHESMKQAMSKNVVNFGEASSPDRPAATGMVSAIEAPTVAAPKQDSPGAGRGANPYLQQAYPGQSAMLATLKRSIIRSGDVAVRVKAIEPAERQIERLVTNEQGYVDSAASTDLASDHPEMKLSLRVPVGSFESTIDTIEGLGVRLSKTINSQDVTAQLVDIDARLATMKAEETTYQDLLRRAGNMDTAMQLRDKLTELRSQIESIAGQRKSTGELAMLSTIGVTLTQSSIGAAPPKDSSWLQETWGQASTFAASSARVVATLAIWMLALSPFWLPVGWVARRIVAKGRFAGATSRVPTSTIL